jgi:hypothetical protein
MMRAAWMVGLLWLALIAMFSSCGLGTEIGNGFKPGDDNDSTGDRKTAGNQPQESDNADTDSDTGGSDGEGAENPVMGESYDAPLAALLSSCTGFLKGLEVKALELRLGDSTDATWKFAVDEDDNWLITDGDDAKLWTVDRSDPDTLVVNNADGAPLADEYTCAIDVETKTNDPSGVVSTVTVERDGVQTQITWQSTSPGGGEAIPELSDVQFTDVETGATATYKAHHPGN